MGKDFIMLKTLVRLFIQFEQEVVEMLKDMQRETGECVGFFVGQVSQLWVIKDLIEKRLNDMGETGVEVRVSK